MSFGIDYAVVVVVAELYVGVFVAQWIGSKKKVNKIFSCKHILAPIHQPFLRTFFVIVSSRSCSSKISPVLYDPSLSPSLGNALVMR